jgi:hypothetical protein
VQYGKCKLYGNQDLVDGTVDHDYASIARRYMCKGLHYEDKPSPFAHTVEYISRALKKDKVDEHIADDE